MNARKGEIVERVGIDVGGAHLKVVDRKGVHIHYCPLWKGAPLRELLGNYNTGDRSGGRGDVRRTGRLFFG